MSIRIKDFIANEWSEYADYDNRRSLPHLMDGLKITQRKALYTGTKLPKNDKPMRVSQFAAKAAEMTAYHHGETSMMSTVVHLAQDFPGTNNYPLMERHGQFGSRLDPSKYSSPRYIHTKLHSNFEKFFHEDDQNIVEYLYDDGDKIEPKFFIPVVPMLLINGSDGTGNGFKSKIFTYGLKEIIIAVKECVKHGKVKTPLIPFMNGWKGKIEKIGKQVIFTGCFERINTTKIKVTELPPTYDNEKYKSILNSLVENKTIKDYENHSKEDKWEWVIECSREFSKKTDEELIGILELTSKMTETFVCWGVDDARPLTFDGPAELVENWVLERLKLYDQFISFKTKQIGEEIIAADMKIKFLEWTIDNDIKSLTKKELISKSMGSIRGLTLELAEKFVGMPIYKMTSDEIEKERKVIDSLLDDLDKIENTKSSELIVERMRNL